MSPMGRKKKMEPTRKTNSPAASHSANGKESFVRNNLENLKKFRAWMVWYPDLFLDLLRPETGGIHWDLDQRVFMRADARFMAFSGCFPRGYGKTLEEVADMVVLCIAYPNMTIALSAQTKENAAGLVKEKWNELVRFYPSLENEIAKKPSFTNNTAEIYFRNGSRIDVLQNHNNAKGQRRKRLRMEESALVDQDTYQDALAPVTEVGRYTAGRLAIVDPCEMNRQINRYTTPGWRGSDEHQFTLGMIQNMRNLGGQIVLGSDWMLPCWYGRGSTKSQILERKKTTNPTAFDQNYGGRWTGSTSGALVSISKLLACRTLEAPVFKPEKGDEIYMAVDVARSQNSANNQSSIAVVRICRNPANQRISAIELINLFNVANTLNYTNQAVIVKRTRKQYGAKICVVDGNGLGAGLVDELLKDTVDPMTGESLGCWNTTNTTNEPEDVMSAESCVFDLKAQSFQTKVLTDFIDVVGNGTLRLLEQRTYNAFDSENDPDYQDKMMPYIQTDLLVEEIANLKLETNGKALSVKKEVSKIDKDRFSALAYAVFYVCEYENQTKMFHKYEFDDLFRFRAPNIWGR